MITKYVELYYGCCISNNSEEEILRSKGTENVKFIRPATMEDIGWVKAMGGYVPQEVVLSKVRIVV